MDASAWITWLLVSVSAPANELGEMLDARSMSATQASEAVMRSNAIPVGVVGCTAGQDADAVPRASLLAKRLLALREQQFVSGRERSSGEGLVQSASARSAGVYPGSWKSVSAPVTTIAGGAETCVAFYPPGASLPN